MKSNRLPPEQVSAFIEEILKQQDPAIIGLRAILKKKSDAGKDYPLRQLHMEEFASAETQGKNKLFSDNEQLVIRLEKEIIDLKRAIESQKKAIEGTVQAAFKSGLQQGSQKGEEKGYAAAKAEYDRQTAAMQKHLKQVLTGIRESRKKLLNEAHHGVLEIALCIAQKILNTEIAADKTVVLNVIRKVLTFVADRQYYTVRIAPSDKDMVMNRKEFWTTIADRMESITIEVDERIGAGGCIIESSNGSVDARINVQFQEIVNQIEELWKSMPFIGDAADGT